MLTTQTKVRYEETPEHWTTGDIVLIFLHVNPYGGYEDMFVILKDTEHPRDDAIYVVRTRNQLREIARAW